MKKGSWKSKYENFKIKIYFDLHNSILKVFWTELISLEVSKLASSCTSRDNVNGRNIVEEMFKITLIPQIHFTLYLHIIRALILRRISAAACTTCTVVRWAFLLALRRSLLFYRCPVSFPATTACVILCCCAAVFAAYLSSPSLSTLQQLLTTTKRPPPTTTTHHPHPITSAVINTIQPQH